MVLELLLCLGLSATADAELSRLAGHSVERTESGYVIKDIAGEGSPLVGIVIAEGESLFLQTENARLLMRGSLAHPRITGPGYKIWAIGETIGETLQLRRVGVLSPPRVRD